MKIGFATFCTENFKEILNCLIESVLEFSKYEITVFSINFDYLHENNRVKSKRIDLDILDYYNICKVKIISSLENDYDVGLILDADMIVTKEIDEIFNENLNRVIDSDFPLFAKHPHNPFNSNPHTLYVVRQYTDKPPKMKYVFASYLFSNKNKWFLQEVLDEMNKTHVGGEDEIIINSLLAKYQVDYDIGYNYLPNGTSNLVNDYLTNQISDELRGTYLQYDCPVKFYIFHGHGCKDPNVMKEWINLIKNKKNII
jgi:hypothetical protein